MNSEPITSLVRKPWRLAAVLLLAALFVTNIYRAATQSIAHDEGVIFEWLLSGTWGQVLTFEHGNHHVVSDLACKFMITVFGPSEISYRTPALLGGLLYFYSAFQISALLFGENFLFLLSVSTLTLNPFVLDYLSCARGYGPALGFFFYALYQLIAALAVTGDANVRRRILNKAGVALGLSIGCNIIMIFPGGALVVGFLALVAGETFVRAPEPVAMAAAVRESGRSKKERRKKPRETESAVRHTAGWTQALIHFVAPAIAVGGIISMLPERLIELEVGYTGPRSLSAILEGLVRYSFVHSPSGFAGLAVLFPAQTAIRIVTNFVIPAALIVLIVIAAQMAIASFKKRNVDSLPLIDRVLLVLAVIFPVAIVMIVVSRYAFGQPYPELRTAMYWLPLLSLACMCSLRQLSSGGKVERLASIPIAAILVLCVIQFVTQFNLRYFAEWSYCAAGKDMMQIVRSGHRPGTRVRIGATWQLEPVINYYRVAWNLDWMDPVYRESPNGAYDYYLLAFGDTALVEQLHLKALLRDRLSGTVLAKRGDL